MNYRLSSLLALLICFTLICPAQIFALDTVEEAAYRDFLQSMAGTPMCSVDMNQDGGIEPGEASACVNGICPIGAEECLPTPDPTCPVDQPSCKLPTNWTCQSDPSLACAVLPASRIVDSGDTSYAVPSCSRNACVAQDLSAIDQVETKKYDGLQDDGARDTTGACLDEILIFNGKAGECFKPSIATGWINCCKPVPKVEKPDALEIGEGVAVATAAIETAGSIVAALQGAAMTGLGPVAIGALVIMVAMELVMTGCPAEGFEVAVAKGEERSIYIGNYCVHDSVLGCLQRAEVHCTFMSKLGRIIHEQGRPQIKRFVKSYDPTGKPIVDWGTVDKPRCEGFKPAEFQALDFSQIDMSEFFDDVQEQAQKNLEGKKAEFQQNIKAFYEDMKR